MIRCRLSDINLVVPLLPYQEEYDAWSAFAYALQVPDVYILMPNDKSVILFIPCGEKEWDVHVVGTLQSVIEAGKWMFDNTDCEVLSWKPTGSVARWSKRIEGKLGAYEENGKIYLRKTKCLQ